MSKREHLLFSLIGLTVLVGLTTAGTIDEGLIVFAYGGLMTFFFGLFCWVTHP